MLSFDDFKKLALDSNLSSFEKVGFEAKHREEKEKNIFPDVLSKLPSLNQPNKVVLDIGCGCSLPTLALIEHCEKKNNKLLLVDSAEMLSNIPEFSFVQKLEHEFPFDNQFLHEWQNKIDIIICYSVLHIIYPFQNIFTFLDRAISLLSSGGQMLVGDIANISKKMRFLSSDYGISFHKQWSDGNQINFPKPYNQYEQFDDSVVFHLLLRYRLMGFETYLLPQNNTLPLNFTREDLLICKY